MNDRPHLARLAADALAAEPVADYRPDPEAEARIIEAMAARIQRSAKRRAFRRGAVVFAAAAAFALAGGAAIHARRHAAVATVTPPAPSAPALSARVEGEHASVVHDGAELALNGDAPLSAGDRVVASASGRASIRLVSGTRLLIDPGGDVTVVRQGLLQMFALDEGSLRADVAGGGDERFVVRTRDAAVEARGSRLRVSTGDGVTCGGRRTLVEVEAGSAIVRDGAKEERVGAGERWPADCGKTAAAPPLGPSARATKGPRVSLQAPAPPETSELKAQTQLFGEAIATRNRGDVRAAITRFDEYLATYPDSALAESAAVNRMQLLARIDRARGADAARAYLQRYPLGFARDDATKIARGAP